MSRYDHVKVRIKGRHGVDTKALRDDHQRRITDVQWQVLVLLHKAVDALPPVGTNRFDLQLPGGQ